MSLKVAEERAVASRVEAAAPEFSAPKRRLWRLVVVAVVLAVLIVLPLTNITIPVIFPGPMSSPGSIQVLAVALIFAGLAVSYDVVFGFAGLLSFGHALFFGLGVYGTNLLMTGGMPWGLALVITVVVTATIALGVGAIALRLKGIAFSMVTLAFVEVLVVFLTTDPFKITGGDEGISLASTQVPAFFRGVVHTINLYWLALGFLVLVFIVAVRVTRSSAGLIWTAVRENEHRLEMLGFKPYPTKLLAFTIGGTLAALAGAIYLLLAGGANPASASIDFSLVVLLMVILGGSGRLWGAAIGGAIYGILNLRLPALSTSGVLDGLPDVLQRIIAEPLFLLGVLFIVIVLVLPSGISGGLESAAAALRRRFGARAAVSPVPGDDEHVPTDI